MAKHLKKKAQAGARTMVTKADFTGKDFRPWTMNDANDEAPKDPGIEQTTQGYTEKDFEGHRAHTVFVGVHVPGSRRHSHSRRHKHGKENGEKATADGNNGGDSADRPITPPAQRVQFILGEDTQDTTHECHPLFSEMEELVKDGDEVEWKETARWVKFEEDVEEGGNRWSKPHVATLSLHSLLELRCLLLNGSVMLDMEATSLEQIADLVCENMVNAGTLPCSAAEKVREALLRRHRHQHQKRGQGNNMSRLPIIRSLAEIGRNHSSTKNSDSHLAQRANSSQSFLHATDISPGFSDDFINNTSSSPQRANFLNVFQSSRDHRGNYLAVPTGDIVVMPSHIGSLGITTWFHSGSSSEPNVVTAPPPLSSSPNTSTVSSRVEDSSSAPTLTTHGSTSSSLFKLGFDSSSKLLSVPGKVNSPSSMPIGDDMVKSPSSVSINRNTSTNELNNEHKSNTNFMRKIPAGAEASNILVGEVDFLDKTLSAFVRLSQAAIMGDLTEVPVPTRFLFILLGPPGSNGSFHEIGRAMATLMSDEIFHEVAYRAKKRDHLLAGIDEFLDAVTVLPPGEWDPNIRIEPPAAIPSQDRRKPPKEEKTPKIIVNEEEEEQRMREESGLSRSGKLFGGLINDIKRKTPFYISDFKDAFALQCIASWIFLYFACLSPIITFGGLLSDATGRNMAAMESLISGFVCGIGYGLFSGQPLTILGSTGPVLVFETIVYEFCTKMMYWNYISFRFWIGTWITIILVVLTAIDASALVCYITRFTEENFACLIAFIFIYKAVDNVLLIGKKNPINFGDDFDCHCLLPGRNASSVIMTIDVKDFKCQELNGVLSGLDCELQPAPNVFLMSLILFLGTFSLSIILKDFKNSLFFPSNVRQVVSDFSVIIAISSMSVLDFLVGVQTPKLEVPHEFKPTLPDRGWIVMPFNGNPLWSAFLAIIPAILGTILIFMDQQITAVIINRKEHKLKKGCGYHLDLFVLAILIQICSIMGLPWFVAATVLSINHVNSLKLESECAAPGEKPQFLGVREQRVTHILIFLMIGCSVLLTPILCHIPMPVLFGVFLYMGVASLKGLQFFDRILILFMPQKYQPDYMFLRQVPIKRVHLFTLIQFTCLVVLWLVKSFQYTSILFPLMLVVMIAIRKSLDCLFTRRELQILDDIMPEMTKRAAAEDLHQLDDGTGHIGGGADGGILTGVVASTPINPCDKGSEGLSGVPLDAPPPYSAAVGSTSQQSSLSNGKILKLPLKSINITEEVNRTGIWKQLNPDEKTNGNGNKSTSSAACSTTTIIVPQKRKSKSEKKHAKPDLSPLKDDKRLSTMAEEEDECAGDDNQNKISAHTNDAAQPQNISQKSQNAQKKEFWSETKVNPKDVGDAAETSV